MRIGKPGRWWLLAQVARDGTNVPIFWTGTWTDGSVPVPGGTLPIPAFTLDPAKALQFDGASSVIFAASIFGFGASVAPIAFDFASPAAPKNDREGEPA